MSESKYRKICSYVHVRAACKSCRRHIGSVAVSLGASLIASLALLSTPAQALEVGFQGLVELEFSDNIEGANAPDEQSGTIRSALIGVYGEQRGQRLTAAFSGELDTEQTNVDGDSDLSSITRFLGAAEFKITPRSWTWYVGDILGGIRNSDSILPSDDSELLRRNVFVTGPTFQYEQVGISRTFARALFVNQTQDNEALEDLFVADLSHERDINSVSFYGARLSNIFTDFPSGSEDPVAAEDDEQDFNRLSASVFYDRQLGFLNLFGEVGVTRFDAEDETLDGLTAEVRATQTLGPLTQASVFIQRELSDDNLDAVESLFASGGEAVGISANTSGFFTQTRIGANYNLESTDTTVNIGAGVGQLDFELLTGGAAELINVDDEDRLLAFANASWSQRLSPALRSEVSADLQLVEFDNLVDNSESLLLGARLFYRLSRSFELELGISHNQGTGQSTDFVADTTTRVVEDIDVTENRASIGVRWAPPSRANQDLTVELRSLLR